MAHPIDINNAEKQVDLSGSGDSYQITVGDHTYDVTGVHAELGTLTFLIDQRSYMAHVSRDDHGVHISMGGRTYHVRQPEVDVDTPGAATVHGDGKLEAPMPGNIVAVKVKVGDSVNAGDPVVVLESMKMQNEIAAPFDGVVKAIHCEEGAQVGFGDLLAEIDHAE